MVVSESLDLCSTYFTSSLADDSKNPNEVFLQNVIIITCYNIPRRMYYLAFLFFLLPIH